MVSTQIRICGYHILEELYNNPRTLVYRGYREADKKPIVIKLLKNPYPDFIELLQFRNQYNITKNLKFPGIIETYSLEEYENRYALVMEDMGGISLKKYFSNLGCLYPSQNNSIPVHSLNSYLQKIIKIGISLCDTLDFLYHQRIIHKDIKPANILINPKTQQVKLIDFSIASLLTRETQTLISPNVLEGTLGYISPEQTGRMNRAIDYRTDFYSLGVTLYELITGKLPFKSEDSMELIHCHIAKKPPAMKIPQPNSFLVKKEITNPGEFDLQEEIPQMISDIAFKLMAKNAEDRYQSALGLKHDLEICLKQLKETGKIEHFPIAQKDICDRFLIPEKLYGRESEVKELLAAFNRVSGIASDSEAIEEKISTEAKDTKEKDKGTKPKSELMLVAGFSGIGKTVVVNEVHKPIVKEHGYFIKGKFDQFNRNIPFSAFVQAFRDLIGQLLSESDSQLSSWKHQILQALGKNGQVIIDVIPELEQVIGKQPVVAELSGTAAQNRFNLLFPKFIQVFATKEHPLVIFLDDLQWTDSASLKLIKLLMSNPERGYLLLIGAYRDNEVSASHPLMLTLADIVTSEVIVNTITLAPLNTKSLNQLIADTLNCSLTMAEPLTQLVYQKTNGNPFFSTQFLKLLHEDGLIKFDFDTSSWVCDITNIRALALTDDVVEFMALKLQKLPEKTQNVLKLAACIGNQFDLATLAIVCQKSEAETAALLWKALQSGFILPESEVYKFYIEDEKHAQENLESQIANYKFLHDRVQQAAYLLIPDEQKQKTHYHIGQLLLQKIPLEAREESIFELVNQLNYGKDLISQQKERQELAQLNLIACRKAKNATAYQPGRDYASTGLFLLGEDAWQQEYEMSLAFHEELAELASLCGDFEVMEEYINKVIAGAISLLEKVNVYRIRIQSNTSQNKLTQAIAIAQELLEKLGVTFPETPTPEDIQKAIAEIDKAIGEREIEDLVNLPIMTDGEKIAIVQIANSIIPATYISGSPLFPLLVALSVKLSIQYGNSEASASAYAPYGIIVCNLKQDVDAGVKYGQLALKVVSHLDAKAVKAEIFNVVGSFILHRKCHIKETLELLKEGYTAGLEVGNLEFVGYIAHNFCLNSFCCNQPLNSLEQETRTYCNALAQLNQLTTANYCRIYWQSILNLLEIRERPTIFVGKVIKEKEFLPQLIEARDLYGLYVFYLFKLMLCYLFSEIETAQSHAVEVRCYLKSTPGIVGEPTFYFYDSLTALAALSSQSQDTTEILQRVEQNQTQLQQQWAHYAPMNHQHKVDLVEAEKCRVLGQKAEAIELYDKAISGAKANEYIQEEALANELLAKFYLDWGKEKAAQIYMQEAYYCYARWGAKAKTSALEKLYPHLLAPILQNQHNRNVLTRSRFRGVDNSLALNQTIQTTLYSNSISENLDFACILKASQALSSEIQLEQLILKLMQVVMENAGAKKVALLLIEEDNLILKALATDNQDVMQQNLAYQDSKDIPLKVINYVKRSLKIVVLDDVRTQDDFMGDEYLIQQQPKSLLCMPIMNQGKLIGLLYLENNLTVGAFTSSRVDILNLLTTQATISLKNAQLYSKLEDYSYNLEQKVEQRTIELIHKANQLESTLKKLQSTQAQLIQVEKMSGLGQLVAGIAHEINNPISFIYGNITPASEYIESLIELINLYQEKYPQSLPEIEEKIIDIDLDFLEDDLPKLLDSMKTGAERIRGIILSLRNFSRLDEAEMKPVDIHSGIDSSLLILQHQIKSNSKYPAVEVIKEYNQLPKINCYASGLNQVFVNIISNAIDALRDKQKNNPNFHKPRINIRTSLKDSENVLVSIADNGVGINESVLNKIFDPFFTTKPVGSGTGLGLSTSYSIVVERHGGKLNCISTPSKGTEFIIELPLKS